MKTESVSASAITAKRVPLNYGHLSQAYSLDATEIERRARPIVEKLTALEVVSDRDGLGIPFRAFPEYEKILDGSPAIVIACLRIVVLMQNSRTNPVLIDAIECSQVVEL